MRYFNNTEKEVIDYICAADSNSAMSSIKKLFETKCDCSMHWKKGILTIYVSTPSSAKDIVTRILNIICLLEYLKTQGLIYIFGNIKETKTLINREHDHIAMEDACDYLVPDEGETLPAINLEIDGNMAQIVLNPIHLSKDISNKIFEFFNCTFFCSETLRHIKNQDYKDDATMQFEENRFLTWKAIKISLGVGIGSILLGGVVGLVSYLQNERHHQESMSETQKIVFVHDTIIPSDQPRIRTVNNRLSKSINDSLKSTKTKSQ